MFLATLISSFYLLTASQIDPSSLGVIKQHHLECAEGRMAFLNEELIPFMAEAEALNQEIIGLSQKISLLAADTEMNEQKQAQIYAFTEKLNQKMSDMQKILPALEIALKVDADLQQIEGLIQKSEALTEEEKAVVTRLSQLCGYIDAQKTAR